MPRRKFDLQVGWLSHPHGIHMSRSFSLSSILILTLLAFSCYEIFTESLTRGRKGFLTNFHPTDIDQKRLFWCEGRIVRGDLVEEIKKCPPGV